MSYFGNGTVEQDMLDALENIASEHHLTEIQLVSIIMDVAKAIVDLHIEDAQPIKPKDEEPKYNVCPECGKQMEVDEEYYASDQSYWAGVIPEQFIMYWCDDCEQAYIGLEKS